MTWIAPYLFRVDSAGQPIGHGYCIGDTCHYHLQVGEAFVEASYRVDGDDLWVLGSSTKRG